MADVCDIADEKIETMKAHKLREIAARPPEAEATGQCLFCEADLPAGVRWCNARCRDDWQIREDRQK